MASRSRTTHVPKETFLHDEKTNKQYRLNGYIATSRKPEQDCLHEPFAKFFADVVPELPPKVDLQPWMTPIEHQSEASSCTANAMAGIYEYLQCRITGRPEDVSRLFIYYNARVRDIKYQGGSHVSDKGSTIPSTIETIQEFGVCPEHIWPYDIEKVNTVPSEEAYNEALQYSISEALELDINRHEMKSCLAQGFPFLVGLNIYKSFQNIGKNGIIPLPERDEEGLSFLGGHALLVVGYSDRLCAFIVRNSWGFAWGQEGYCYIPYEYMERTDLCTDAWTVKISGKATIGWDYKDAWDLKDEESNEDKEDE